MPAKMYWWTVVFRNDTMGFQKTVTAQAADHGRAVIMARELVRSRGYDADEFAVIEVKRNLPVVR
jgi:hypothetical protein